MSNIKVCTKFDKNQSIAFETFQIKGEAGLGIKRTDVIGSLNSGPGPVLGLRQWRKGGHMAASPADSRALLTPRPRS